MNLQQVIRALGSALIAIFLTFGIAEAQRRVPSKSKPKPTSKPKTLDADPNSSKSETGIDEAKAINKDIWVQIYGASVFSIYQDVKSSETVYATTPVGLYKTIDKGFHWTFVFAPPFPEPTSSMRSEPNNYPPAQRMNFVQSISSPSVMYITAEWSNGASWTWITVWRSDDGGSTWNDATGGVIRSNGSSLTSFQVSSQNHLIVYLQIEDVTYKTLNGGKSWGQLQRPGVTKGLSVNPNNSDNILTYGLYKHEVWESKDGGLTWNQRVSKPLIGIEFHPTNQNVLLGRTGGVYIFLSEDGGRTWNDITIKEFSKTRSEKHPITGKITSTDVFNYPPLNSVEFSKESDQVLYAATSEGVYISENRGKNWLKILNAASHSLAITNANIMYVATSNGIMKSSNGGGGWRSASFGLPARTRNFLSGIDDASNTIYVGVQGGYVATSDNGFTWQWVGINNRSAEVRRVLALPDGTSFLTTYDVGDETEVSLIKGTTDGKFTPINNAARFYKNYFTKVHSDLIIGLSRSDPQTIYSGENISDDGGFSWRKIDVLANVKPDKVAVSPLSSKIAYMYGGKTEKSIYVTTDGGDNWRETSLGFTAQFIYPDPKDMQIAYLTDGQLVFRSHDAGQNWVNIKMSEPLGTIYDIAVSPSSNSTIYLASDQGVWRSSNGGKTWRSYNRGLNGDSVFRIIASKNLLLCKGRNGIYRLSDEKLSWAADVWERSERPAPKKEFKTITTAPETSSESAPNKVSTDSVPTESDMAELIVIEERASEASIQGDRNIMDGLLDETYTFTNLGNRKTWNRATFLSKVKRDKSIKSHQCKDYKLSVEGEVAVLSGVCEYHVENFLTVMDVRQQFTDRFRKRDGAWKLISSQILIVPNR